MHRKSGFTIVELLIVIVVIAILATIGVVAYSGIRERAVTSQRASVARTLSNAIENYYTLNGTYPAVDQMTCTGNDNTSGNTFMVQSLGLPSSSLDTVTARCGMSGHQGLRCTYFHPSNTAPYFGGYSVQGSPEQSTFNYCSNKQSASVDNHVGPSGFTTHNCYSSSNATCIGYVIIFFTGSKNVSCESIGFKQSQGLSYICSISNLHGTYDI